MIDRKALWISITVILAITAALFWRLSLLPDWHKMPLDGPGSSHTVNGLRLLIAPASMALTTAVLYARKWFAAGTDDALRPWRHWANIFVIANSAVLGLFFVVIIARSFGYGLAVDRLTVARTLTVASGVLTMAMGNALPKMPWLTARFRSFQLDPWQQNRQLRFVGKLMVGLGLFVAIGPLLLQPKMLLPAMLGLWLVMMAAVLWHRAKVRRDPSPLP